MAPAVLPDEPQCSTAGNVSRPPHIIVMMADDLGHADTGYGGSSVVRTPVLDKLAAQAVHLTHFRAPTWCAPARASFLTGRHGWELGIAAAHGRTVIGEDSALLSETLRAVGYFTAIVGKFHFNPRLCRARSSGGGFGCGFDAQYGFVGGKTDYYNHHRTWSRDGVRLRERGYATELFGREAARLIRAHAASRGPHAPFFLWLTPNAPHQPLQASPDALAAFSPPERVLEEVLAEDFLGPTVGESVRTYAAMVWSLDHAFGKAVEALRHAHMLPHSLIAFMSDNGGPMIPPVCNGRLRGGKGTPYEGGVRAPAFVWWPRCLGRQRRESGAVTHMVDWLATLAAAAASGLGAKARRRLLQRSTRKAPHSASLWPALAAAERWHAAAQGGGGGGGGAGREGEGEGERGVARAASRRQAARRQAARRKEARREAEEAEEGPDQGRDEGRGAEGRDAEGRALAERRRERETARRGRERGGAAGGGAADRGPARRAALPGGGNKRQLVLMVAASGAGVLRGRWKLVLAAPRCLAGMGPGRGEARDAALRGFLADEFLLAELEGGDGAAAGAEEGEDDAERGGGRAEARLRAALASGVRLQLYNLQADPHERRDLMRDGNATRRSRAQLAGSLLGHYLSAARVAVRSVARARQEGRVGRAREEMTVWFCRQMQEAWEPRRWRRVALDMCALRSRQERGTRHPSLLEPRFVSNLRL